MSTRRRRSLTFCRIFFSQDDFDEMQLRDSRQEVADDCDFVQTVKTLFRERKEADSCFY